MKFKTPPFQHQLECFEQMKDKDYWALFAEPGLGKTKIILDVLSYNKDRGRWGPALVVCPNTLVENWEAETRKHSDLSVITLLGTRQQRLDKLAQDADVFVINYEATRVLHAQLSARKFAFLVLDESTAVKNFQSQQSRACYAIATKVPRRFIMSGTPVMNSPLDIFAQYKILNPVIFGISFYRFRGTYAVMGGYMNKQAIFWRRLDDLRRRIFSCATRKTKAECLDLPDKLYQVIRIDMSKTQKEIYKKIKEDFIYEFQDVIVTAPIVLTRLMRFSQITAGFTKDIEGVEHAFKQNPKIDWVMEFLNDLDHERKVVIFCRFTKEIEMLQRQLRFAGIRCETVCGKTKDRIDCVNRFNDDKDVRVFIGQIQTTGMGINLTSASYVIFLTNSYSYGERVQCEDRCHRIGQTKNVTYIDLLARGTIDEGIHKALEKKQSLSTMVMGDIIKMV